MRLTARPPSPAGRLAGPSRPSARARPAPARAAAVDPAATASAHPDALARRQAAEARRLAAAQEAELAKKPLWHLTPGPPNTRLVSTPADFAAVTSVDRLVVAEFFMPSCPGCRTLLPKLHSIAANNPDVDFVKINVEEPGMADVARGAGIERMPGFALYRDGGACVAAFSITLARVAVLRAEIAANKECVGECAFHEGEA